MHQASLSKNLLLGTCFVYVIICLRKLFGQCNLLAMNLFCLLAIGWELLSVGNCFGQELEIYQEKEKHL